MRSGRCHKLACQAQSARTQEGNATWLSGTNVLTYYVLPFLPTLRRVAAISALGSWPLRSRANGHVPANLTLGTVYLPASRADVETEAGVGQHKRAIQNETATIAHEPQRLFEREGVSPLHLGRGASGMLSKRRSFLRVPPAVRDCVGAGGRFLWIRNIAKPDFVLTVVVTALTCATVALGASPAVQNKALLIAVPTMITFFVLLRISAGIGLYWGVSSMVSLLQAAMIRRARLGVERAC